MTAIDKARERVAQFLGCSQREVIFTGSATEANNLALKGVIFNSRFSNPKYDFKAHIITSAIEHDSVLEVCRALEKEGVEVTYLPVSKEGIVKPEDVEKALKDNTVLVSIMYANNEIGTIQPIAEIADVICNFRKQRANRKEQYVNDARFAIGAMPYFHTDAVQAVNYLDCNVNKLGVDLMTLSSHKIYGPKGVGALFIRKGTPISPLIHGGGQEFGIRSGTENVAGIVGFGEAIFQISSPQVQKTKYKIQKLRDRLIDGVLKIIPEARLNGSKDRRLPNNANFLFPGVDSQTLLIALDQEGIAVSSGSACSMRTIEPSHVLIALGLSPKEARSSLRVTLGRYTTQKEIDTFLKILPRVIKRIKIIS